MNVLLVRTSALGDIVHSLPVLSALRRADPTTRIAWVVEEVFAPLLEGHPDLAAIIPVATRRWRRWRHAAGSLREIANVRRAMRAFAPQIAIDLMGNHKGAVLARMSGAGRVIGPRREDRREPSSATWIGEPVATPATHAVERVLELLVPLGIEPGTPDFAGERLLAGAAPTRTEADRPYVMIQAGAGWGNKQYPADWWGQVAQRLHREADVDVFVPVAPGEAHLAEAVVTASAGCARAVEAGPWGTLVSWLRGCSLLLGGDTGPLHLAHALSVPVLCVMGPTDPERHGPYGASHQTLCHRLPCSFCYKRFRDVKPCLLSIPPDRVADRALALLSRARP